MNLHDKEQLLSKDLVTLFLEDIYTDSSTIKEQQIETTKDQIDSIFLTKLRYSKSIHEIKSVFESYLAFFDAYQEFIPRTSKL